MDHILNLIQRQTQEQAMAKARLEQPLREAAQIVVWNGSTHNVVRYVDMKEAKKQFTALVKHHSKISETRADDWFVLSGATSTAIINVRMLDSMHLVDVEANNHLMADTQRRMNAMMQLP